METNEAKLIEFTHIPPEAGVWRQALHLGNRLIFRKGSEIMHGGQKGAYLYFLYQGEARLMRTTLDGREKILMSMTAGASRAKRRFSTRCPRAVPSWRRRTAWCMPFRRIACGARSSRTTRN